MIDLEHDPPPRTATQVELRLPADLTRSHLVRAVTASIAVAEDYDVDQIADLRLAVDEVCSTVIPLADLSSDLRCVFTISPDRLEFTAEVDAQVRPQVAQRGSFGWQVLLALTDEAVVTVLDPTAPGSAYVLRIQICKVLEQGRR